MIIDVPWDYKDDGRYKVCKSGFIVARQDGHAVKAQDIKDESQLLNLVDDIMHSSENGINVYGGDNVSIICNKSYYESKITVSYCDGATEKELIIDLKWDTLNQRFNVYKFRVTKKGEVYKYRYTYMGAIV